MSPFRHEPIFRLLASLTLLLGLCACERETYTSWSCNSPTESKIAMVLRKAQMEFKGAKFDYCGSLGSKTYFDQKCPSQTEQSKTVFTPSSGILLSEGQEYQCAAL